MIEHERITELNDKPIDESCKYVLYWMQQSQRTEFNHALEFAVEKANQLEKPLVVCFGITDSYPEANIRHYQFMLEGLTEVEDQLKKRGIKFVVRKGEPFEVALELSEDAAVVIADMGYLRFQRDWREKLAKKATVKVVQIESDAVVPITTASNKREYSAGTIRKKINSNRDRFLISLKQTKVKKESTNLRIKSEKICNINSFLNVLKIDTSVAPSDFYKGGISEAKRRLKSFIKEKLDYYPEKHNDPVQDYQSNLSAYLHFGQISPIYIALEVIKSGSSATEDFLEQLIVRRELSMNFVWFTENYDEFSCIPGWAKSSLAEHKSDKKVYNYEVKEFEKAQTHDPYWNAAQLEMTITGKMHNYMRMYWGKKILEWAKTPQRAFEIALFLNNKYELDGRDPNGYTGVAWCFGNHDRPWTERDIFGKVRYMNAAGLERKFKIKDYTARIEKLNRPRTD